MMPHYPNLNIPANINYLYLSTPSISLISKQVVRLFVFCFVLFLVFGFWFYLGEGVHTMYKILNIKTTLIMKIHETYGKIKIISLS